MPAAQLPLIVSVRIEPNGQITNEEMAKIIQAALQNSGVQVLGEVSIEEDYFGVKPAESTEGKVRFSYAGRLPPD